MYSMNTQLGLVLRSDSTKRPVKIVLFPRGNGCAVHSVLGYFVCISSALEVQLEVNQLCMLPDSVHHSDCLLEKLSF